MIYFPFSELQSDSHLICGYFWHVQRHFNETCSQLFRTMNTHLAPNEEKCGGQE